MVTYYITSWLSCIFQLYFLKEITSLYEKMKNEKRLLKFAQQGVPSKFIGRMGDASTHRDELWFLTLLVYISYIRISRLFILWLVVRIIHCFFWARHRLSFIWPNVSFKGTVIAIESYQVWTTLMQLKGTLMHQSRLACMHHRFLFQLSMVHPNTEVMCMDK